MMSAALHAGEESSTLPGYARGTVHAVKWIKFLGRWRPIILQNENGPCPLIAICNVLLLLGRITLANHFRYVDNSWIIQNVHNDIVKNNRANDTEPELRLNMQHLINEVAKILPCIQNGMDVNVRFGDCEGFEFTPELSVYDLTAVRLLHGWIVDGDELAGDLLKNQTFNGAMDRIIAATADRSLTQEKERQDALAAPELVVSPQRRVQSHQFKFSAEALAALKMQEEVSASVISTASVALEGDEFAASMPLAAEAATTEVASQQLAVAEGAGTIYPATTVSEPSTIPACAEAPSSGAGVTPTLSPEDYEAALIMQTWLNSNVSQLTYAGLTQLSERIKDMELAVFFRNNHFSTIFKHSGRMYLLVTDEGYQDVPEIVWECLDDVAGNTQLVDHNFELPLHIASQEMHAVAPEAPPEASSGIELPPDFNDLPADEQEMLRQVLAASTAPSSSSKGAVTAGPRPTPYQPPAPTYAPIHPPAPAPPRPMPGPRPVPAGRNVNDRYGRQADALRSANEVRESRSRTHIPVGPNFTSNDDQRMAYELHQQELRAREREMRHAASDTGRRDKGDKGCVLM
jgi:hypothetical protein